MQPCLWEMCKNIKQHLPQSDFFAYRNTSQFLLFIFFFLGWELFIPALLLEAAVSAASKLSTLISDFKIHTMCLDSTDFTSAFNTWHYKTSGKKLIMQQLPPPAKALPSVNQQYQINFILRFPLLAI